MALLSSLTNRIFLASASLIVVSIGLAAYRVNASVTEQAERDLQSGLTDAAALVDLLSRRQFQDFVKFASLVADLPRLSAAASNNDPPTALPVARDFQRTLASDIFVVLGRDDHVLANAGPIQPADADVLEMVTACRQHHDGTAFRVYSGSLIHVIALPLTAGTSSSGTLLAGFPLGRQFADRIKAVTKSDIVVVSGSRILASTLDDARTAGLTDLTGISGAFVRRLGDEDYVGRVQLLGSEAASDEPVALVLRSRSERLRFLPALRVELVWTALAAIVVATLIGYGIARTVTGPVRALAATMRAMAETGDLTPQVPDAGRWGDEDARMLAGTFGQLTAALARFRQEAAQRERLSALGRWSTVVAHEVRNPLMIIKSATRTLRKRPDSEAAEVAASIDEEVQRLNRVVTDVLDFAKPIRFDLANANLAEICRDAARAAQSGPDDVPIAVEGESTAPIFTDHERLRSVLVNVLSNAQHAVRAHQAGVTARSPVRIVVSREGVDRWAIAVIDRGIGVPADDLARMFEPFFTTRRTGSGLGLALARNIIEGLGGTIAAESEPNAGTIVRISLPERPAPVEAHT